MTKTIDLTPDYLEIVDSIDKYIITEKFHHGPRATEIIITDHDSGKELGRYHNKILVPGSVFSASNAFGVEPPIKLPSYNKELSLENTTSEEEPKNDPIVCLFCVDDSGCGTLQKEIFKVNYNDRIEPETMFPFRYVDKSNDLTVDQRQFYYGRKELTDDENNKVAYYFKTFDTTPQMHLRYIDGTQINDEFYNTESEQAVECYVETRLRITRLDFRDYFEAKLGWDKARVSSLSLCYAWYDTKAEEEGGPEGGYKYFQDIMPYSKLNFSYEWLVDLTKAIDFQYRVYY